MTCCFFFNPMLGLKIVEGKKAIVHFSAAVALEENSIMAVPRAAQNSKADLGCVGTLFGVCVEMLNWCRTFAGQAFFQNL